MPEPSLDLLREAISKRAGAVLSLPTGGPLSHFKTRFLEDGDGTFLIEPIPADSTLLQKVISENINIGMAFRIGPNKVIFTSILQPSDTTGLCIKYPQQIHLIQRRAAYRVSVEDDAHVDVRVWKIPDHAILRDRPSAALEVGAKLVDLSVGGLGLNMQTTGEPTLHVEQRLRVLIHFGEDEAILDGRVRHVHELPDKSQRIGAQFKKLENDLEGRQTLSKLSAIVAHLQRQEILRSRLKEQLETMKMQPS